VKRTLLTLAVTSLLATTAFADPIHDAVARGDLAGVQAELDKGVDVNAKTNWGDGGTPLHWAAYDGHKEIVELLVAEGADVNAKDVDGLTPLYFAVFRDRNEIVELLIAHGADVDTEKEASFLSNAALGGYTEIVERLIAKGADVNAKDGVGETPLLLAAWYGHKETVELLIAEGADVNAKVAEGLYRGWTPLHWAASWGHAENAELLIAKGADVNPKDWGRRTPLDQAFRFGKNELADLLRKHGGKTGQELALMPPRLVQHGRFAFSFDAKEGKVYEVQDSFDLLNWEVIKAYTGTGTAVRFDEERDHDPPKIFYRVKVVE
jgi:cytohesin